MIGMAADVPLVLVGRVELPLWGAISWLTSCVNPLANNDALMRHGLSIRQWELIRGVNTRRYTLVPAPYG